MIACIHCYTAVQKVLRHSPSPAIQKVGEKEVEELCVEGACCSEGSATQAGGHVSMLDGA